MTAEKYDYAVLGAGVYGLYAAKLLIQRGYRVLLLEYDDRAFSRASYVNQARVHQGYHYPRSIGTAIASAKSFNRFVSDYRDAINLEFKKIYAISRRNSYTSAAQFLRFCEYCGIPAAEVSPARYFRNGTVAGAYETVEYTFDPGILRQLLIEPLLAGREFTLLYGARIEQVTRQDETFLLDTNSGQKEVNGVINCTYASTNQLLMKFGFEPFNTKFEIAEIILCDATPDLRDVGITVMDGPFFSVMPFGKTGMHSLTAVEFTPHKTSTDMLPTFDCQHRIPDCSPIQLQNCTDCTARPRTSYAYMHQLAKKYLLDGLDVKHRESMFAIKPILKASETDDSRPTVVRVFSHRPFFLSVLSGKINTVYEMESVISDL